jgi:hypothetical protein
LQGASLVRMSGLTCQQRFDAFVQLIQPRRCLST